MFSESNILKRNKKIYKIAIVITVLSVISAVTIIELASIYLKDIERILMTVLALALMFTGIVISIALDREASHYRCKFCNITFTPSTIDYICGIHTIRSRRLRCPNCNKIAFFRKEYKRE